METFTSSAITVYGRVIDENGMLVKDPTKDAI
jgi:hypothetical protein